LNNITAGVRERQDANRTREAGHLDAIQGVVASTPGSYRNGDVGFIDWLGAGLTTTEKLSAILCSTQVFNSGLLDTPRPTAFGDMKAVIDVTTIFIATRDYLYAIILHDPHAEDRFAYVSVSRYERLNRVDICSGNPA
jgi:hypothetical protein